MKILFHLNTLGGGGAERVASLLANRYATMGYSVTFVTSFAMDDEYQLDRSIVRYNLDSKKEPNILLRNYRRIRNLRRICRRERPDVVVGFMCEPNFRVLVATLGFRCKRIVSVRNDPSREYEGLLGSITGKIVMPLLADICVFQTGEAVEWFPKRMEKKARVIKNPVSDVFFNTPRTGENGYWVAVGRLSEQKNYSMLLHAFRDVIQRYPGEQLRIYGEGELRVSLELLVQRMGMSNNVRFCGRTHEIPSVLSKAKAFVMTSDYEGMPNALMEAMAMGLPCVATDCPCGGVRELLSGELAELMVKPGDIRQLVQKMLGILGSDADAQRISLLVSAAAEEFSQEKVLPKWDECFLA